MYTQWLAIDSLQSVRTLVLAGSGIECAWVPTMKHGMFWERPWVANSVVIGWTHQQ